MADASTFFNDCNAENMKVMQERCKNMETELQEFYNNQIDPEYAYNKLYKQSYNFIKKETLAQVFSCEFFEILRTPFLIEHLWWLLLNLVDLEGRSRRFNLQINGVTERTGETLK